MSLTASVGIKLGPLVLTTLVKHFLARERVTEESKARDELLYDEAFTIVKSFLEASSRHTIEDLQSFSNTRIPASPLIHSIRLLIPISTCNLAATYLIKALGGEEKAIEIAGGVRWWQVRGLKGIDANWVAVKKDWQGAKEERQRRSKSQSRSSASTRRRRNTQAGAGEGKGNEGPPPVPPLPMGARAASVANPEGVRAKERVEEVFENGEERTEAEEGPGGNEDEAQYSPEMDPMRCMLYIHGGGYCFGSIDQERFCLQRYARKMNGRVLAINYRLAPQYPFPCAIHDALAAYLYLIRPPPEALHTAVNPSQIILSGDSAGGGTVLALLQVIRDTGLPLPAGAALISPWGDLTHSFPSVFQNTSTDIIPRYGLSLYKPSTLWPPPSEEMDTEVRRRLTHRIRTVVQRAQSANPLHSGVKPSLTATPSSSSVVLEDQQQTSLPPVNQEASPTNGNNHQEQESKGEEGSEEGEANIVLSDANAARTGKKLHMPNSVSQPATALQESLKEGGSSFAAEMFPKHPAEVLEPRASEVKKGGGLFGREGEGDKEKGKKADVEKGVEFKPVEEQTKARMPRVRGEPVIARIDGEKVEIKSQIHLYAMNHQMTHPLVSPVMGYLGGLPPLYIMCSDKEVLRDEIIYLAHKAAHPERYPIKDEIRDMYPPLKGIEERYGPTNVHLQVYDETCHVLPLFSFTTPAKYCYRAVAQFCKFVAKTSMDVPPPSAGLAPPSPNPSSIPTSTTPSTLTNTTNGSTIIPEITRSSSPIPLSNLPSPEEEKNQPQVASENKNVVEDEEGGQILLMPPISPSPSSSTFTPGAPDSPASRPSASPRSPTGSIHRLQSFRNSILRRSRSAAAKGKGNEAEVDEGEEEDPIPPTRPWARNQSDQVGPRFVNTGRDPNVKSGPGMAGNAFVYAEGLPFSDHMIRERVSTNGILRPLEPEEELAGCTMPLDAIGVINEAGARRYLQGVAAWDKKFSHTIKSVARHREKNLRLAKKESLKVMDRLHARIVKEVKERSSSSSSSVTPAATPPAPPISETLPAPSSSSSPSTSSFPTEDGQQVELSFNSPLWSWSWALSPTENPPPSSLVARRDTSEARRLSKIADAAPDESESRMSGNNLWAVVGDFLSAGPKDLSTGPKVEGEDGNDEGGAGAGAGRKLNAKRSMSRFFKGLKSPKSTS